jgi:murein DD-endopeptidase MepM/ murein hydrolase activator NlpD
MAAALAQAASSEVEVAVGVPVPEVQVPFGCGLSFRISQGHQVGSHLLNDAWAWDFRMPEGTPVVSAQDGVVKMARGDSSVGGCDLRFARFANYVVVSHEGGVETQYLHFRDVVVKAGDRVKAGDLLGYSGKTGWACGPHLHFKVARQAGPGWNNPSIPARIAGYGDPALETLVTAPACMAPRPDVVVTDRKQPPAPAAMETAQGASPPAGK